MEDTMTVLRRSDDVTAQVVGGEAILIRVSTGTYFSLNKVGTEFWEQLDGHRTVGAHAREIAGRYSVEEDVVSADLLELAGKMLAWRVVEVV